MKLSPPAEVLLSYFTGLAPVGQTFEVRVAHIMADLEYIQKTSIYRYLGELIRAGCVRRLTCGGSGASGVLMVLRRLEGMAERHLPREETGPEITLNRAVPTRVDWFARIAEIPADTRTLTQRMMGDPLPARSALYLRQHQQEHA